MPHQPGSGQRYWNLRSVVLIPHTLMMQVVDLGSEPDSSKLKAATLLVDHFDEPRGWPNLESARDEVARVLGEGFALAAMNGNDLLGWVGGLPEYHGRVWELHPMVVRREHRRRGIGRTLVSAFEAGVADRGGLTITLGTDDDSGMTTLSGINLYTNIPKHIAELRDLGRGHPFGFYRRLGFVVTGVIPDANGRGFPDIYMSKPVK